MSLFLDKGLQDVKGNPLAWMGGLKNPHFFSRLSKPLKTDHHPVILVLFDGFTLYRGRYGLLIWEFPPWAR